VPGYQQSIGRRRAAAMFESEWWLGREPREIAKFQLLTRELCLPFAIFHEALETTLGRDVMLHEFGFNVDGLIHELLGEADPPTIEEILDLVPSELRCDVLIEE
jgi:hypothetical protein